MPDMMQGPITGKEYRFLEDSFTCKDCAGPVRYEDVVNVSNVPGDSCFDIRYVTPKGKTRKLSVILDGHVQIEPLRLLFQRKITNASIHTRSQTAWEACGTWVTMGLCLAGLVLLIIVLNIWGRGATVTVPIWILPFLMIGSFLSTEVLLAIAAAILVLFGIGAVLALRKRQMVWEITKYQ